MPNPESMPDGYSAIISEIAIVLDGVTHPVVTQDYLTEINMQLSNKGAWTATLRLFDATSQTIEDLLTSKTTTGPALVKFRWGWDSTNGIDAIPWFIAQVTNYELDFQTNGTMLDIHLVANGALNTVTNRLIRSWPAGTPINVMFTELARDNAWITIADSIVNPQFVQYAANTLQETSTVGESDIAFVVDTLCSYALDNKGRGGFRFFFDRDNNVHFHNNYFNAPIVSDTYTVSRDPNGRVISFKPDMSVLSAALLGMGNNVFQGFSSKDGTRLEVISSYQTGPPNSNTAINSDSLYNQPIGNGKSTDVHSRINFVEREPDEFAARISNQYETLRMMAINASLIARGSHRINPMDRLLVTVLRPDGSQHYTSGVYFVLVVTHIFSHSNGWTTEFQLCREGTGSTPDGVEAKPDDTIQTNTDPTFFNQPNSTQVPVQSSGDTPRRNLSTAELLAGEK
jgi:hypothetical protein